MGSLLKHLGQRLNELDEEDQGEDRDSERHKKDKGADGNEQFSRDIVP